MSYIKTILESLFQWYDSLPWQRRKKPVFFRRRLLWWYKGVKSRDTGDRVFEFRAPEVPFPPEKLRIGDLVMSADRDWPAPAYRVERYRFGSPWGSLFIGEEGDHGELESETIVMLYKLDSRVLFPNGLKWLGALHDGSQSLRAGEPEVKG